MNCNDNSLDLSNLSSRKLWTLLSCDPEQLTSHSRPSSPQLSSQQLQLVEQELRNRQHYLDELNSRQYSALH